MMKLSMFAFLAPLVSATVLAAAPGDFVRVKEVMLEKLRGQQSNAGGLYTLSGSAIKVGQHTIDLKPAVETDASTGGKNIMGVRVDLDVDGVAKPEATFASIGIAETRDEAIAIGAAEWYLGFAQAYFQALAGKSPLMTFGSYDVYAGAMGLRGSGANGWVDGSEAMNRKILNASLPLPAEGAGDFIVLDLKMAVPAVDRLDSECRINGEDAVELAEKLVTLDWPRTATGYLFKQVFILKKNERPTAQKEIKPAIFVVPK